MDQESNSKQAFRSSVADSTSRLSMVPFDVETTIAWLLTLNTTVKSSANDRIGRAWTLKLWMHVDLFIVQIRRWNGFVSIGQTTQS